MWSKISLMRSSWIAKSNCYKTVNGLLVNENSKMYSIDFPVFFLEIMSLLGLVQESPQLKSNRNGDLSYEADSIQSR